MSLIDPKHLLAPFQHTMHIVTIVFLVLLFSVFRLATGGVDIQNPADELRATARGESVKNDAGGGDAAPSSTAAATEQAPRELQDIERALGLKQ